MTWILLLQALGVVGAIYLIRDLWRDNLDNFGKAIFTLFLTLAVIGWFI